MQKRVIIVILILLLIGIPSTLVFAQASNLHINSNTSTVKVIPLTTVTPSLTPEEAAQSGPPLSLTLSLLCFCLAFSLVIGVFVLGIMVRSPGRENIEKEKEEHGL
ncbi:MAG: hypothetical protein U0V02_02745 [Anaerolineales bacterium]